MIPLSETAYPEQTISHQPELWTVPQTWSELRPAKVNWLTAFVQSAARLCAPSAVLRFFLELDLNDRLLCRFGFVLAALVPVFALCGVLNHTALQASPWIKPIKFSISFVTFVWTVSLILENLRIPAWQRVAARWTVVTSVTVEMLCLAAQAWRGALPHTGANLADALISQGTTLMVSVNTAIIVWIMVLFCGKREWTGLSDRAMVAAIRCGIVIFLVGNAVGGYMLARGSHTVGAADGGPGLPFLNWSTIAGDLRIAHFIGIHGIQIVPLFALVLWQMTPRPRLKRRVMAVYTVGAMVLCGMTITFVQAALGHPLLPILR